MTRDASAPAQGQDAAKEAPKYKLLEPAYIDDILYGEEKVNSEKGVVIFFEGIPGPHMKPLNAAARAMFEKHKVGARRNLIDDLTRIAPDAKVAEHTHPGT